MAAATGSVISECPLNMVHLSSGCVPSKVYLETMDALKAVAERNFLALGELLSKCNDPDYQIINAPGPETNRSKTILMEYGLIDEQERIHAYVRTIVVEAVVQIQASAKSPDMLKLVAPKILPL